MGLLWECVNPFIPGKGDWPLPVLLPIVLSYFWAAYEIELSNGIRKGCCVCSYPRTGLPDGTRCPECGGTSPLEFTPFVLLRLRPGALASVAMAFFLFVLHLVLIRAALAYNYHLDHFTVRTAIQALPSRELRWWPAMTVAPQLWIGMLLYPVLIRFMPQRPARHVMWILAIATSIAPLMRLMDPASAM